MIATPFMIHKAVMRPELCCMFIVVAGVIDTERAWLWLWLCNMDCACLCSAHVR